MNIKSIVMMIGIVGLAFCACAGTVGKSTPNGFTDDFEAAKAEAAKSGRKVLVVFSGSDWCHWCKVLEEDYLSKPEFVDEAKKDFVLVFIDNPNDESVLSDTGKKNNKRLTKKYDIDGFPTLKILDADGKEIADSQPEDDVSPKGYAEQLRRDVKIGPLLKQHLKPLKDEFQQIMETAMAEMATLMAVDKPQPKDEAAQKAKYEQERRLTGELIEKVKPFRAKVEAASVPAEIADEKTDFIEEIDFYLEAMERARKMTWDDMKQAQKAAEEEAAAEEEEERRKAEKEEAAWLRDWSENVRTNMTLETCASFRETKLRPFLLREMDPSGQASEAERKLMHAAVDAVWGEGGFDSFGRRKDLVEILNRVAKKPFAEMVQGFVEGKDIQSRTVAWIVSGKFKDEDMRCVFWTLRNDISRKDATFCELLQQADVDAWIKATWRIGVASNKAWKSRGGGWASDVTDEGREGYRKSGDECRAAFGEAMSLKPYPEPVYFFDTLGPFSDEVFEAATKAQLDFPWLYRQYLWYNCFPRWCGSHRKMKAFAERCYATKRHDTMVPFFYAESLLRMISDGGAAGGPEAYFKNHPDELDKILEVSLPQINSTNAIGFIRQHAGAYATLAYSLKGEWEKAGETFRSFSHATMPSAIWSYIDNFSNWWMIWDGISGPNRARMQAAQRLYATGDFRGFLRQLDNLRAQAKLSNEERIYAEEMSVAARLKTTFLDGEPIVATFPRDKTMWLTYGGNWGMNGEYAYVASTTYLGGDPIAWDIPMPGVFRMDCEIAPHGSPKDWSFTFYQMPDDPQLVNAGQFPYLKLSVVTNQCRAAFGQWHQVKDFKGGTQGTFAFAGDRIKLSVVYDTDGGVKVYANGEEKPLIETNDHGQTLKAITTGRLRFNGTSVRLLSLRVSQPNAGKPAQP